jgi:hypothetical protein
MCTLVNYTVAYISLKKCYDINKIFIFTAIIAPACAPGCGENAHCEYGDTNRCVCNPGTSGNPYSGCGAQEKTCATTACGVAAECRQTLSAVECVCPIGFAGNPYVHCQGMLIFNK